MDVGELLGRAHSLADEGDWEGSADVLRDHLSDFDEEPAVHCWLGVAERELGLSGVAYERFKEVARAVERVLDRDHAGLSMQELPFVLTQIRDPDPIPLISRFLSHPVAEVVAAAIESMA